MSWFARMWSWIKGPDAMSGMDSGRAKRYSLDQYFQDASFTYGNHLYAVVGSGGAHLKYEDIENSFSGYVSAAYKADGVVFAVIEARRLLFTEARFQWQEMTAGRPGNLADSRELDVLRRPWPNGSTGDLLARMEQDASLSGNFYAVREGRRLRRLRPDWVTIILTAPPAEAVASDVAGYLYRPGGYGSSQDPAVYLPEEICHWAPIPDPDAMYRGMSWLTPVVKEVQADKSATDHKLSFFRNAATPNIAVSLAETVTEDQFKKFITAMETSHRGVQNAYKTLYLGGGADVTVIGKDFRQLDFKAVQGAGETRIAAAGRVPPIIVGLSEGLQAATYSNYGQARRAFGDHWARPQWRSACAALETILQVPASTRLWIDDRDIAFLREDQKDAAEIAFRRAATIRALTDAGYVAESVVRAVNADDFSLLVHSGLFSVQLQPPMPGDGEGSRVSKDQVESLGTLIRSGFLPDGSLSALDLPPIPHTGLLPVTLAGAEPEPATPPPPAEEDDSEPA